MSAKRGTGAVPAKKYSMAFGLSLLAALAFNLAPSVTSIPDGGQELEFTVYPAKNGLGGGAGEPSIGVNWQTGAVFINYATVGFTGFNYHVAKVTFDDNQDPPFDTWSDVSPPLMADTVLFGDPVLFTDSLLGRTFAGGLETIGGCSQFWYTDDDGELWIPMERACAYPGWDHPTLTSGPWAPPLIGNPAYPHAVYYCAQPGVVQPSLYCSRSADGGLTWHPTTPPNLGSCWFLHGRARISPTGTIAIADKDCGSAAGVMVSENNGLTWTTRTVPGMRDDGRFDPMVGFSEDGWMYYGAAVSDGAFIALSKDNGRTWEDVGGGNGASSGTKSFNVGALADPEVKRAEFAMVVAGDDERAAFAFLGSKSSEANQGGCNNGSSHVWNLYVAMTYDEGVTWTVEQPTDDPFQKGPIGDGGSCRNLLDFTDITVDAEGRVLVGLADGCLGCAGPSSSTSELATVIRQSGGNGLFAVFDDVSNPTSTPTGGPPLQAFAGGPYSGPSGQAVPIAGSAVGGTSPYSYTWELASRPPASGAGPSSFTNPTSADAAFTPDVVGAYTLRLRVVDAATQAEVSTASLQATDPNPSSTSTPTQPPPPPPPPSSTYTPPPSSNPQPSNNPPPPPPDSPEYNVNHPPHAAFSHRTEETTLLVDASASWDSNGDKLAYTWSFGDASTAQGVTAQHAYESRGTYDVRLTVKDPKGSTDSIMRKVAVGETKGPIVDLQLPSSSVRVGVPATFDASKSRPGSLPIKTYEWDWGLGRFELGQPVETHTFLAPGEKTLRVRLTDDAGLASEHAASVLVLDSTAAGERESSGSWGGPFALEGELSESTWGWPVALGVLAAAAAVTFFVLRRRGMASQQP